MRKMRKRRSNGIRCGLFFFALTVLATGYSHSVEHKNQINQITPPVDITDFSYSSENRRNPFEPVNLLKAKKKRETGGIKTAGYELEELKFVGELKADKQRFAMMEDTQGKGVMLKKGDFLNKNLWVVDIPEGRVVLGYKLKGEIKKIDIDLPRK